MDGLYLFRSPNTPKCKSMHSIDWGPLEHYLSHLRAF